MGSPHIDAGERAEPRLHFPRNLWFILQWMSFGVFSLLCFWLIRRLCSLCQSFLLSLLTGARCSLHATQFFKCQLKSCFHFWHRQTCLCSHIFKIYKPWKQWSQASAPGTHSDKVLSVIATSGSACSVTPWANSPFIVKKYSPVHAVSHRHICVQNAI